ncbi:MAG: molybdopterin-dependent oxidoreductase, partial [Oscillospiraceae bacterium]|nr:molybdopterin-dependent oxidoreductase [Oscillospiraceae bacterium]
ARVISVDTTKARALPGVVDIVTWEDEDIKSLKSFGALWGPARPWLDNLAEQEGEEIAVIVVAESEDICADALRLLDVEWDILPHIVDLHEGRKQDAPIIRPQVRETPTFGPPRPDAPPNPPKKGNVAYSNMVFGDIEAGFSEADQVIEYDMYLPAFAATLPNPSGSLAWWFDDPYSGGGPSLRIEGAVRERKAISQMYGLPLEKTEQQGLFMGGKYCDWGLRKSQEITPLLAKRTGRPVRCVNTREETFDFLMNQRYVYVKVGFKNDGLITAIDDFSIADGGIWGSSSFGHVGDQIQGPYNTFKCRNVRQQMEIVDSNRGKMYVSGQHCPFNWDIGTIAIYLIAEKLGKDPIDIARVNLHGPESPEDLGAVPSFEACVKAGREQLDWNPRPDGAKRLPDGRLSGSSFRYQMCPRHALATYTCKLELRDGVVHMPTQGPLFGVYAAECNAMVVAEELGIEYGDVSIDFDYREKFTPVGGGADGTTASAWSMKECAGILKRKILEAAVEESDDPPPTGFMMKPKPPLPFAGMRPDDLDIADGKIYVKSKPETAVPLEESVQRNLFATFYGRPPTSAWMQGMGKKLDTMNAAWCEVAVDTETGEVEVLRFSVAADPGKVMRKTSLESQIDQVMYFSHGCQLLEDFVYDERTGVRLNNNMLDYKKPGMLDIPPVEREFLETRSGNAAYGANGISHSLANTHMIIIAIHNATGVWVDPPATPDKVLKALGKI